MNKKKIFALLLVAGLSMILIKIYLWDKSDPVERINVLWVVGCGDVSDATSNGKSSNTGDPVIYPEGTSGLPGTISEPPPPGADTTVTYKLEIVNPEQLNAIRTFDTADYSVYLCRRKIVFISKDNPDTQVSIDSGVKGVDLWKQGSDWAIAPHR